MLLGKLLLGLLAVFGLAALLRLYLAARRIQQRYGETEGAAADRLRQRLEDTRPPGKQPE